MLEDDFEFYRDLGEKTKVVKIEPQEKREVRRKSNPRTIKMKTKALIAMGLILIGIGAGVKTALPKAKAILEYNNIRAVLALQEEDFLRGKIGLDLGSKVAREKAEVFNADPAPMPFDYSNEKNIKVLEDGTKVGAIIDYYNGFDEYLIESGQTGYWKSIYEQQKTLEDAGIKPNAFDEFAYTTEELESLLENGKGLGV